MSRATRPAPVRFARLSARSTHWRTRFERTKRNPSAAKSCCGWMAMGNTRRRQSIVAHFNRRLTDGRGDLLRDATFVQMAAGLRLALARRPGRRVPFGRRRSLRTLGTTRQPGCLLGRHGSFLRLHSRGECVPTIHAYPCCRMACHDCGNRAWLRLVVGCLSPPRRARHRRVARADGLRAPPQRALPGGRDGRRLDQSRSCQPAELGAHGERHRRTIDSGDVPRLLPLPADARPLELDVFERHFQ